MTLCNDPLLAALIAVARQAGDKILEFQGAGIQAEWKGDGSPVTAADQAAEALILPVLKRLAPDVPIVSEENAASHSLVAPDRFWLVDPLDGTKEFLKTDNRGAFTVNIALIEACLPTLGLVYAPALNRLFVGQGNQAFTEDSAGHRRLQIRAVPASGPVALASASHRDAETTAWLAARGIDQTQSIGSSLKFCLLAAGEADVYPRFGPTMEWDTAAGDAVLRAAGGRVETLDGKPYPYAKADYRNGPFIARGAYQE